MFQQLQWNSTSESSDDNFQLQWPLHRLFKCQSLLPTTFLPRTTLTRTIRQSCSQGQTVYPIVKFKTTPAISKILSFFFLNFLSNKFFIWFPYSKAELKGVCHGWCKCLICNWSEFSPSLNIFVAFWLSLPVLPICPPVRLIFCTSQKTTWKFYSQLSEGKR